MRYIKNLINNILFLLKHDILVNNMIKERRIQKNRDELINTQIDIKNINDALSNYKEGINNIFNQYKMDYDNIKLDMQEIDIIKDKIYTMSNKRVSNKGGK